MSNLEIEQTVLETELAVASLDRFLVNRRVTTRELLASLTRGMSTRLRRSSRSS